MFISLVLTIGLSLSIIQRAEGTAEIPEVFQSQNSAEVFFKRVDYSDLRGWGQDDYREVIKVFLKSCERIIPPKREQLVFTQLGRNVTSNDFYGICRIARAIENYDGEYIRMFFEKYFVPYRVIDTTSGASLFTGYYIPKILAKRTRDEVFRYPIYRRPPELINGIKYYTRKQIHSGALDDRNLEMLYTNDPVELYFMHIQGSGIVKLVEENRFTYVGFDGKNNCNYSPLGKNIAANSLLIPRELRMDARTLKRELKKDIARAIELLNANESYVFFKFLKNSKFTGAFGTELIPFRTMAVDSKYIPLGFPLWVNTKHTRENSNVEFSRILFANDVGSAVKGVNRGDIFFGFGKDGEENSSFQYASGQYFLLIPIKIAKKLR
ncbi:MAG: MltA domain-containing protein [Rickettsiales bacterium]|nr:MltA domain-containing protein [Rickettsiales bacterium]